MEWSPTVAYCVGLITTDGCLSGDRRHIEFCSKDLELVQYVRDCFAPHLSIGTKPRGVGLKRYFRVQVGSVELYRWLVSLGLTPRKSKTLGPLNIPEQYFAHFLRGHLDGDGSIRIYDDPIFPNSRRLYVRFHSASPTHLDWLEQQIARLWSIMGHRTSMPRVGRLNYAKYASIALLKRIYERTHGPYLYRKHQQAEEFLIADAEVAELVDAAASGAVDRKVMGVRLPPSAPHFLVVC